MSASWDKSSDKASAVNEIKELMDYFNNVINLIPPKIYFNKNEEILENIEAKKRKKFNDGEQTQMSAKSKNKRIKLDPNCIQTVTDIAQEYCQTKKKTGKFNDLLKKIDKRMKKLKQNRMPDSENKNNSKSTNGDEENGVSVPKIFNKKGDLVFSKFDLFSQVDLEAEKEMSKNKNNKQNKTSLKGLLEKSKRDEQKISKLQESKPEQAQKLKEKKLWNNVLEKSEGNKMRDDPKLLAKSLKRKKKEKQKRRETWAERKETVAQRRKFEQLKRQQNIQNRKQKKKESKIRRLQKKRPHLGQ